MKQKRSETSKKKKKPCKINQMRFYCLLFSHPWIKTSLLNTFHMPVWKQTRDQGWFPFWYNLATDRPALLWLHNCVEPCDSEPWGPTHINSGFYQTSRHYVTLIIWITPQNESHLQLYWMEIVFPFYLTPIFFKPTAPVTIQPNGLTTNRKRDPGCCLSSMCQDRVSWLQRRKVKSLWLVNTTAMKEK